MEVVLKNKQAFKDILKHYSPSTEAIETLRGMDLVILLGISGAGRNTIINELTSTGKYHFVISDTTRPPKVRDGKLEQDGVQYFFRDEEDLLQDLKNGLFLEAELIHDQQVSGISIRELKKASESGKTPINEVDLLGTVNILKAKPDTKFFFVVPPSYDEWLRRLQGRETMSSQELRNRTHTARLILEEVLSGTMFHFVVNDNHHHAAMYIDGVVSGKTSSATDEAARITAQEILSELTSNDSHK